MAKGYDAIEALGSDDGWRQIGLVLVHEANPVYSLPAQGRASPGDSKKVPLQVSHLALYLDETAALCDLLLPSIHALERWDDRNAPSRA